MREITITANEAGQRLDKFLTKYLNEATKSFFYKMLRKKNITLNGKKANGDEKLQIGDTVKLFLSEETIEKFSSVSIQKTTAKLDILYEDSDVLFINKPAGMLSQKAQKTDESVVEHVISYLLDSNQLTKQELQSFRPSICNRLDRNTSGLITAGKSLRGLQELSKCFKERSMGKYYIACVNGIITTPQHLQGYLRKDNKTNKVTITKELEEGGDWIETDYVPLAHGRDRTVLEVHLITGKTHQIRAHLAYTNHPIIGDAKYGDRNVNAKYQSEYGVKHQLLHAYRLEFPKQSVGLEQLKGNAYIAPLPPIYQKICKEMRGNYEHLEFKRS
ncbi:MAG: RluA family pseudouridine synthase [Eubacteriales bacterium]